MARSVGQYVEKPVIEQIPVAGRKGNSCQMQSWFLAVARRLTEVYQVCYPKLDPWYFLRRPLSLTMYNVYWIIWCLVLDLTAIYWAKSCRPDQNVAKTCAEWVKRRLDKSAEIHNAHNGIVPIVCLGGGSPHKKPLLSVHGHVIHEGTSLAAYLVQKVRKNHSYHH